MDYTADVPITIIANVPWTSDLPTGPTVDAYPEFDGDEQWTRFRRMVFSDFAIIDVPPTTPNQPSLPYSFGSPVVTTCSFWLCMQAISIKETSGRAEQTMISSKNLSYSNIYSIDSFNYGPNSGMSGTFSNVPGYNMEGRSFTANMTSLYQYPAVSSEARYVSFEVNADAAPLGVNKPALLDRWDYVKNDSQGWADRIAKSLTNKLRLANQCHPDDDIYAGEVWIQQAYIRVSWPWAAYPATLFAAAMALFTTTVVRMLRLRKHAAWHGIKWGNGTLAMLLCDVSDAIKRRARGSYRSTEALLDAVGDIPVCLEGDEEGWTFRTIS
jgi:hypothetical protein